MQLYLSIEPRLIIFAFLNFLIRFRGMTASLCGQITQNKNPVKCPRLVSPEYTYVCRTTEMIPSSAGSN